MESDSFGKLTLNAGGVSLVVNGDVFGLHGEELIYTMCCTIPWHVKLRDAHTHARYEEWNRYPRSPLSLYNGPESVRVSPHPVNRSFPHFIINQWKTSRRGNSRHKPELFLLRGCLVTWSGRPITRHASSDKSGLTRAPIHVCDIMNPAHLVCLPTCGFPQ